MTKMRDLIKNNVGLKFLSVAIAVLLWLIVVNVSKPEITDQRTVKLEVVNEDAFASENKTWELDGKDTVTVYYKVRTDQQRRITANDFRAYINLADYSITGSVPIYVEVLNDKGSLIEDVTTKPQVIKVMIEDIQQKKFELTSKTIGTAAEGYKVADIIISPESVYATGPESEIGKISSIGIEVDVNGLSETTDGTASPVFYDANGNRITNVDDRVSVSSSEINYTATIHKKKTVSIVAHITGTPAAGYEYDGTAVAPDSIQLAAVESVLDKISVLNLPQISIDGATGNVTERINLTELLPAGVELAEPGSEATVTVRVTKTTAQQTTEAAQTTAAATESSVAAETPDTKETTSAENQKEETETSRETETTEETQTAAQHEGSSSADGNS